MSEGPRYAIYFVPAADSALHRFGSGVLGYDCHSGADIGHSAEGGFTATEWDALTREPRSYGFHATLKAPFYLSASSSEMRLASALQNFAALGRVVPMVAPAVRMLSGFIAIVPREPCPAVEALAADCVTIFDAFRAPMSAQERGRRMAAGLNRSQVFNLERWGYPYLFDEFRFHMTLTGRVPPARRDAALASLNEAFVRCCGERPIPVDRLALMRQDGPDARFRVVHQVALGGRA